MKKDADMKKHMAMKGIIMIVIGVAIWLNDSKNWVNWAQFVAIIAVVLGALKLMKAKGCC